MPPGSISFKVQVFANGTDPVTGLPAAVIDTTSALSFEDVQNAGAVSHGIDPTDSRKVIVASIVPFGGTALPFSFRVHAAGQLSTTFVTASGTAQPAADLRSMTWDGNSPVVS
jgi:hypothetical protein